MKNFNTFLTLCVFFIFASINLSAQNNWAWARDFGQSQTTVYNTAINQNNDLSVLGQTTGIQIIDGTVFNNVSFMSTVNANNGNVLTTGIGTVPSGSNYKVKYDDLGDFYLKDNGSIQKYNSQNINQWSSVFSANGNEQINLVDFAVDANGNTFVLGTFNCFNVYINGNGNQIINGSYGGICLFKFDAFGFYVWNKVLTGFNNPPSTWPGEVVVGGNNIFVSFVDGNAGSIKLLKINQGSQVLTESTVSGTDGGIALTKTHLTIDENNDVYLGADFTSSIQFSPTQALINQGQTDYFIAKYDVNLGNPLWISHLGSPSNEHIDDVAYSGGFVVVSNGNGNTQALSGCAVPTGTGLVLIRAINSTNGTCTDYERIQSIGNGDVVNRIIADNQGNFYFTGMIASEATFGNITVGQGNPGSEPFVAKYNPTGVVGQTEIKSETIFSVSPNPSRGHFTISSNTTMPYDVELFTIEGLTINKRSVGSSEKLDLTSLENGVYLLRISQNDFQIIKKIVIVK